MIPVTSYNMPTMFDDATGVNFGRFRNAAMSSTDLENKNIWEFELPSRCWLS